MTTRPPSSRAQTLLPIATVLSFAMLTGCTSVPAPAQPVRKVQTLHELVVKLKYAYDNDLLSDSDFYARELGYPLVRPLKVPPKHTYTQEKSNWLEFDEGELAGYRGYAGVWPTREGIEHMTFSLSPPHCMRLAQLQAIWGVVPGEIANGAHWVEFPTKYYRYQKKTGAIKRYATFIYGGYSECLADIYMGETYNERD